MVPERRRLDPSNLSWFLASRRDPACAERAVQVLYQTAAHAESAATGAPAQHRENRRDNFFKFVTEEMHGTNLEVGGDV